MVGEFEYEGEKWLHVSCSRKDKFPKWKELKEVKELFIGKDRRAVQVFPKKSEYVNIHPNCLHLWCCLERDTIPDFSMGLGTI